MTSMYKRKRAILSQRFYQKSIQCFLLNKNIFSLHLVILQIYCLNFETFVEIQEINISDVILREFANKTVNNKNNSFATHNF